MERKDAGESISEAARVAFRVMERAKVIISNTRDESKAQAWNRDGDRAGDKGGGG